ncbi:DUF2059 domain-containing protein [Pelomonas sp. SE-A7]|uniref:DUF2059 domain-containing protein n=1 Tax=Pelomonas sp. SE-A7 TaxID=3054953 RepID=UPI00259CE722|nr:DUF2059 domain-containing protein [Pelomonas sp. SE-A7]MDM4765541.1 DUF2059 domain-containing protein [Pelomonas sp. SE-A7]
MSPKILVAALAMAVSTLASAQSAASTPAASPAKKELIAKLLAIQTASAEVMARGMVSQPLVAMGQEVRIAMGQVPESKREAVSKAIEAEVKKYADESVPLIRDRIVKLAPETVGKQLDERFTEDELRQIVAWLESPTAKKFDAISPELGKSLQDKVVAEVGPTLNNRLRSLQGSIIKHLGLQPPPAAAGSTPASKPAAKK